MPNPEEKSAKKGSAGKSNIKNFNASRTKAEVDVAVAAAIASAKIKSDAEIAAALVISDAAVADAVAATKVESDAEIAHLKKTVDDQCLPRFAYCFLGLGFNFFSQSF